MSQREDSKPPPSFWLRYILSSAASFLLNPAMAMFMVAHAAGALVVELRLLRARRAVPVVPVQAPFAAGPTWRVARGGVTRRTSHSWGIPAQRYAYDFVSPGPARFGPGRRLADYPAYNRAIVAAAPGIVVAVRDGRRDHARPGSGAIDWRATDPRGNFVLVRQEDGLHALYAHLARGSVAVKPGCAIAAGTLLGRCGNSGHSTEPHLHFHLQDHRCGMLAAGRPPQFVDLPRSPDAPPFLAEDDEVTPASPAAAANTAPLPAATTWTDAIGASLSLAIVLLGVSGLVLLALTILHQAVRLLRALFP